MQLRNIVRKHEGTVTKKYRYFGAQTKTEFDTPALVLTTFGAQIKDEDVSLKYEITPNAVLSFLQNNRKFFVEETAGAYLKFDKTHSEKEPFTVEEKIQYLMKDNIKVIDYVS